MQYTSADIRERKGPIDIMSMMRRPYNVRTCTMYSATVILQSISHRQLTIIRSARVVVKRTAELANDVISARCRLFSPHDEIHEHHSAITELI